MQFGHWLKRAVLSGLSTLAVLSAQAQEATKSAVGSEAPELGIDAAVQVILYLALLALLGAGVLFYVRRGGRLVSGKAKGHLQIEETHVLGAKQYLVVVNYKEQRMLLGVGQGFVNHLCYLEEPVGEDLTDLPLESLKGTKKKG